jgi:acyl-CoA thioester hydrolase
VRKNRHTFRVIYGDTDTMGVVYYANYLRYFEAGRTELLRAMGINYRELEASGFLLPCANASVRYRSPARYDDELELETILAEVGMASVRITYNLYKKADAVLVATGETTHACIEPSGKIARLPQALRAKLTEESDGTQSGN